MIEWRTLKLSQIGKIVTGKTPPTSDPANFGGPIPFVTPSDMAGERSIEFTSRTLSAVGAKKVGSSFVASPAVVVSCIGSDMGKAALVDRPFVSNQQINSVIPYPDFERLFIYYNLSARKDEILGKASGAAQPIMNKSEFGNLELLVPDLATQKEIAKVLAAFDDKIELNRRTNETLGEMAQAIFRDWFVDFGPVRRKAAGEADPVAIMGDLTPDSVRAAELAALFPDAFGDDGLPMGWAYKPVSEFAEIKGGKQLEKQHILPSGPNPVFGGAGVMGYSTVSNADGYVITIGRVGAYCGQFFGHRGAAWVNNNASLIKALNDTPPEWLILALRKSDIESIKKGAAQPFVSNGDVAKLPLVDAGLHIRAAFGNLAKPLFVLSEARHSESVTLAETRDYLLPRLMSGAVRVAPAADAERL